MSAILDRALTTLAFCWTIERRDGAGLALTSHDATLTVGGVTYRPAPGLLPAAIERRIGLAEADGEAAGAISHDGLTEEDLAAGRWDGARVTLTVRDWEQPGTEPVALIDGVLGEVALSGGGFRAALSGAAARLDRPVAPATSPECRAEFGGKQCRIDLAGRSARFVVAGLSGNTVTLDRAIDARFRWGRARFLSGGNAGVKAVVAAVDGASATLLGPIRMGINVGDRIELREGCDKSLATCRDRFANVANFRGEPHLPGNDLLTRFPGN